MARLIDADALRERHCKGCKEDIREFCRNDPVCASLMWVDEEPTVDAVEVVRCKGCKHWDKDFNWCDKKRIHMEADDFCSYGEQKGGAENE